MIYWCISLTRITLLLTLEGRGRLNQAMKQAPTKLCQNMYIAPLHRLCWVRQQWSIIVG